MMVTHIPGDETVMLPMINIKLFLDYCPKKRYSRIDGEISYAMLNLLQLAHDRLDSMHH